MTEALRPLIESAQAGDREALDKLAGCVDRFVRMFSGSLSRYLRRTQGSTLDFVNEGLAEALAHLDKFEYRSDEEFYGWVARLIRSRILDAIRREKRQKRDGRPFHLDTRCGVAAADPTPSQIISMAEVRETVKTSMLRLQLDYPSEMEAVLLKIFEGHSWPEIQTSMNLGSQKRARTLCARGLDLLRPRVEKAVGQQAFGEFLGL